MADSPTPQGEKARRPRPFGTFLIFLMILVVLLVAFGSSQLSKPKQVSQDEFGWNLYTGAYASIELKGGNEVTAELRDGGDGPTRHKTSFTDASLNEDQIQAAKAMGQIRTVQVSDLVSAMDLGLFKPEIHRHLTATQRAVQTRPERQGEQPEAIVDTLLPQTDLMIIEGTARAAAAWAEESAAPANILDLPEHSGRIWLRIAEARDLADLDKTLVTAGSISQPRRFDLTEGGGTSHGKADTTLMNMLILWGPWALIFFVFLLFMRQMRNQSSGAGVMSFGRSRAQMYNKESHTGVVFDDVAGAQEAKEEVREVVEFLKNPGRFTRIGGRIPRGVLLNGPPGCGKTLLAKAIAGEAEVPFFSISGSDFVEMFVGVGASRVRDLFKQARENSPCIIFLDEIDAVGRRRGSGMGGGHDEREQTLNAILVEMDGFATDEGIIVVAATNRPDVLDPALMRPGRFDREVTIDLPDLEGRRHILDVHLAKVKAVPTVDSKVLAKSTPGYSGADLAAIVNEAAIMAVLDKEEAIEMRHLEEAATKVRYGRKKISRNIEAEDLEITAYHEAGHTIIAAKLDVVDMPHKVTIVPRGRALGSTMMLPDKESYHMQRKRLLGQLAMMFGGRVAEDVFCGDISAGASDDINRATELARAMVTELGMSDKVGPINYGDRQGSDFLGTELMSGKWHSEETARVIDEEVERILRDAYQAAQDLIAAESPAIERLTQALLKYETLDRDEILRLIEGTDPADLRPDEPSKPAAHKPEAKSDPIPEADGREDMGGLSGEAGLSPA
jgi:cell division protease FtsH